MKLLAIDTSTDACSVALMINDDIKVDHRIASQQHAGLVLPMVDQLFAAMQVDSKQLDAVVFGRGPGSFTGVRIGVAVAQGIAFGADIGVVGISTLQSIAQGCLRVHGDTDVHVCIDARMDEVYYARFAQGDHLLMHPSVAEIICSPETLAESLTGSLTGSWTPRDDTSQAAGSFACWAGSGAEQYGTLIHEQFKGTTIDIRLDALPNAQDLLSLAIPEVNAGGTLPAELATPVYLRDNVAKTTAERDRERGQSRQPKTV